jgi:hypothetical protein
VTEPGEPGPRVASKGWIIAIVASVLIAVLSLWNLSWHDDACRAVEAASEVVQDGDVVFVTIPGTKLPRGPFLHGAVAPKSDLRGFLRVLAVLPRELGAPPGAEVRQFGDVNLVLWRPEPWRLLAEGSDVFPRTSMTIVRGSARLECRRTGDKIAPFSCDRAGGHSPLHQTQLTSFTPSATGFLEISGTHPQGTEILEVTSDSFEAESVRGFGAPGQTLVEGATLQMDIDAEDFVLRVGAGQGGRAHFQWWAKTRALPAHNSTCVDVARALDARDKDDAALRALRRGANGLPCRLRAPGKPDR